MSQFTTALREFIASPKQFQFLYNAIPSGPLLVLDSSFNPPHVAHLALVHLGLTRCRTPVLLLLSLSNADKAPQPAAFDQRLQMMYLMGKHLERQGWNVSIGVCKSAKFVDKARVIPNEKLYFLIGYDTLVRIVDQKYYSEPVSTALAPMFEKCSFICLTRGPSLAVQSEMAEAINSQFPGSVELINDVSLNDVSSSHIREAIHGHHRWRQWVIEEIEDYINENQLYSLNSCIKRSLVLNCCKQNH